MTYMLCRNQVADFRRWRAAFQRHADAHRQAGLRLVRTWRSITDPNDVHFMFEVASLDKARAFLDDPAAVRAGAEDGVLEREYHFVDESDGY